MTPHPALDDLLLRGARACWSRERWQAECLALLPAQTRVLERNERISELYAEVYLRRRDLFKWAGMAAFASHHVRLALWPQGSFARGDGHVDLARRRRWLARFGLDDLDELRRTNSAIFEDAFWIHAAYLSGGIQAVRAALPDGEHPLVEAFEDLDTGCRGQSDECVWRANVRLLRHEQEVMVQPHFERLSRGFSRLFSAASTLGFQGDRVRSRLNGCGSFYAFCVLQGLGPQRQRPRITELEHRWDWIERSIVPRFRRFEADDSLVLPKLEAIAA